MNQERQHQFIYQQRPSQLQAIQYRTDSSSNNNEEGSSSSIGKKKRKNTSSNDSITKSKTKNKKIKIRDPIAVGLPLDFVSSNVDEVELGSRIKV